jgi:HD-GYP domain-containing protein (c-di-GMP phosphodiesterase class II)
MIFLKCIKGEFEGQVLSYDEDRITIGRSSGCHLTIDDSACSRQHASIELHGGGYVITDLGSTNGLHVNEKPTLKGPVRFNDRIRIGGQEFEFLKYPSESSNDLRLDDAVKSTWIEVEKSIFETGVTAAGRKKSPSEDVAELRKANEQLQAIYRLSRSINSTVDREELYDLVCENIIAHLKKSERLCIFVMDRETKELVRVRSRSREDDLLFKVSQSVLNQVQECQEGILVIDAQSDSRFESSMTVQNLKLRSLMCVPIIAQRRVHGVIYVENNSLPGVFEKPDLDLLTVFGNQAAMALENTMLYEQLERSFYETIRSLSNAIEAKDRYTRGHSARVAHYVVGIGKEFELSDERLEDLRIAAELHDIGKIAIPEEIINCQRKLTDEEFEEIKAHPQLALDILKPIRFSDVITQAILHHHERYDGSGYPDGLSGKDIPFEARILNLADAFDAMMTQRPYNQPRTVKGALEECQREAGKSFDASCVTALMRMTHRGPLPEFKTASLEPEIDMSTHGS